MADPQLRRPLIEFEIALDAAAADEARSEDWGRAFLTPSLPLVWDASYLVLARAGMGMASVEALADEVLGEAGFAHRTVVVGDEADGERLAAEAEAVAGWEAERTRYMVWRGAPAEGSDLGAAPASAVRRRASYPGTGANGPRADKETGGAVRTKASYPGTSANGPVGGRPAGASGPDSAGAREEPTATVEPLRRRLMAELTPAGDDQTASVEQLLEYGRRLGEAGSVRWFVAPADDPGSACCLLSDGAGIGQVEDVATLEAARGRGLATAIVNAARTASQKTGDTTTFLTADAADWPQFFYEGLGFVPVGDLHTLRRRPTR